MNKFIITARLAAEPELKYLQSGKAICKVIVAVKRDFKNKTGEYEADFFNLTAFEKKAEIIAEYMRKGHMAGFICKIQNNNYEDKEGKKVYKNEFYIEEIEFLESKGKEKRDKEKINDAEEFFGKSDVLKDDNSSDLGFPF